MSNDDITTNNNENNTNNTNNKNNQRNASPEHIETRFISSSADFKTIKPQIYPLTQQRAQSVKTHAKSAYNSPNKKTNANNNNQVFQTLSSNNTEENNISNSFHFGKTSPNFKEIKTSQIPIPKKNIQTYNNNNIDNTNQINENNNETNDSNDYPIQLPNENMNTDTNTNINTNINTDTNTNENMSNTLNPTPIQTQPSDQNSQAQQLQQQPQQDTNQQPNTNTTSTITPDTNIQNPEHSSFAERAKRDSYYSNLPVITPLTHNKVSQQNSKIYLSFFHSFVFCFFIAVFLKQPKLIIYNSNHTHTHTHTKHHRKTLITPPFKFHPTTK